MTLPSAPNWKGLLPSSSTSRRSSSPALLYLGISLDTVALLFGLVFTDTLFGILKSLRMKIKLDYDTFVWGILSKFSILFIPFFLAIVGKTLGKDFVALVDFFIYVLIANDVFSVITNILSIKTKKLYKKHDFIEVAINQLRGVFIKLVQNQIEKIKIK
jgi:hypothetical protein